MGTILRQALNQPIRPIVSPVQQHVLSEHTKSTLFI